MSKPGPTGLYIVLEGCDGVGKTTQINLLSKTLTDAGQAVRVFQEPDIRSQLVPGSTMPSPGQRHSDRAEVLLQSASRALLLDAIIASRDKGHVCLVERNYLATLAAQYYAHDTPVDYDSLGHVLAFAAGSREADLTIVLDAPTDILASRAATQSAHKHDNALDIRTLEKMRAGYLIEAKHRGLPIVFTNGTPQEAFQNIWQLVLEAYSKPRSTRTALATPPVEPPLPLMSDTQPHNTDGTANSYSVIGQASGLLRARLAKHGVVKHVVPEDHAQTDVRNHHRYYTPKTLPKQVHDTYVTHMDALFQNYRRATEIVAEYLEKIDDTPQSARDHTWAAVLNARVHSAVRNMLPMATTSTIHIDSSGEAFHDAIVDLLSSDSKEARAYGKLYLRNLRDDAQTERLDDIEAVAAYRAHSRRSLREYAAKLLPQHYGESTSPVALTNVSPRNELDLVSHMLYEYGSLSARETVEHTTNLSYKYKADIYGAYIGNRTTKYHKPGSALGRAHYSWDLVCTWDAFDHLLQQNIVHSVCWQRCTPRYGYDIPEVVESAGAADIYLDSFDRSLELHSILEQAGRDEEAQYAVLYGHKNRWQMTLNGQELIHFIEAYTSPSEPAECRMLAKQMYDKLAEVHPLMSEHIILTNKNE